MNDVQEYLLVNQKTSSCSHSKLIHAFVDEGNKKNVEFYIICIQCKIMWTLDGEDGV